VIDACRVTSTWSAGADQTWDTRPTYDCGHHVAATVSGTQLSWAIDSGFGNGGALDIALVPDPADPTPYAVSFVLPTSASFQPSESDSAGFEALPPLADGPTPAAAPPPATGVPAAGSDVPPGAVAPLVAEPSSTPAPQFAATPSADSGEPRSRTAGAAALAAFALILLLRSFVTGRPRGHAPKSLLILNREGS
jgi:hypothetical protein